MLLPSTVRHLDDLTRLLDESLGAAPLPTWKPLRPSQTDKLVKQAFNSILSELHGLRLQLLIKATQINGLRDHSIVLEERQKYRSKKIIDPKTILHPRSIKVFDKRLLFCEALFQEVLALYEKQFKQPWIAKGEVK